MHKTAAVALLFIVSTIPALAQNAQAPLPDVTVTAPAPIQRVNPFNPFSGDTRVDEARWPVIPCTGARIDLGQGAKCQTGTQVETFLTMSQGGRCDIARQGGDDRQRPLSRRRCHDLRPVQGHRDGSPDEETARCGRATPTCPTIFTT